MRASAHIADQRDGDTAVAGLRRSGGASTIAGQIRSRRWASASSPRTSRTIAKSDGRRRSTRATRRRSSRSPRARTSARCSRTTPSPATMPTRSSRRCRSWSTSAACTPARRSASPSPRSGAADVDGSTPIRRRPGVDCRAGRSASRSTTTAPIRRPWRAPTTTPSCAPTSRALDAGDLRRSRARGSGRTPAARRALRRGLRDRARAAGADAADRPAHPRLRLRRRFPGARRARRRDRGLPLAARPDRPGRSEPEVLFASLTLGGVSKRFYRFRTPTTASSTTMTRRARARRSS